MELRPDTNAFASLLYITPCTRGRSTAGDSEPRCARGRQGLQLAPWACGSSNCTLLCWLKIHFCSLAQVPREVGLFGLVPAVPLDSIEICKARERKKRLAPCLDSVWKMQVSTGSQLFGLKLGTTWFGQWFLWNDRNWSGSILVFSEVPVFPVLRLDAWIQCWQVRLAVWHLGGWIIDNPSCLFCISQVDRAKDKGENNRAGSGWASFYSPKNHLPHPNQWRQKT